MENNQNWKVFVPFVTGLALAFGFWMGTTFVTEESGKVVSNRSDNGFDMLTEVINYIDAEYVDEVSKNEIIEKTVKRILKDLDPHSYYISPEELAEMNEPLEGNFDGIGIQFNIQNDTLVVIDPIVGGPSEKVGIKAGDRIIRVNDSLIAGVGVRNRTVLKLLKGKKGTKVTITVTRRKTEELNFSIIRDKIPIHSVSISYMLNEKCGYIKVDRFGANTSAEFYSGMRKLVASDADRILIDLRGNGGGYMNAATDMLDGFFDKGELLVYTQGKSRAKSESFARSNEEFDHIEVVVLMDESSASASEIFAGAIQDHDRGVIVGRRSFGKGLVQEQNIWPNGGATRLTIARYYTPSGRCIQKPYSNGVDAYNNDYYHRYETGELLSKDSINITDSSIYKTDNGRTVFGSGGIIPDVFVALDTTQGSAFLNQLLYNGVIYGFAFQYADYNRASFGIYENPLDFKTSFEVSDKLMKDFISYADDKGVVFDTSGFERSENIIISRLKANIARNIWGNEGFYPIWNERDRTINEAISLDVDRVLGR